MEFIKQVIIGVHTYVLAHKLIVKHRLWWYIIAPGIINCLLFILGFSWFSSMATDWAAIFTLYIKNLAPWATWLHTGLLVGFIIFYLSVYKYLILVLMAPLLALLSERVEFIITGHTTDFNFQQFIADVLRGILLALRNFCIEMLLLALLFICSFIPLLQLFSPVLAFYISSYYYGFSMLDYSNERRKYTIARSIAFTRLQKGVAFGNGAIFYLLLIVPYVGWVIAPAYAVTAATIARLQIAKD